MTECCKEALWIQKMLKEINQLSNEEIIINEDNISVLKMITNDKILKQQFPISIFQYRANDF